jgi:hypothetical protein
MSRRNKGSQGIYGPSTPLQMSKPAEPGTSCLATISRPSGTKTIRRKVAKLDSERIETIPFYLLN